jgi:hypothetical protein
MSSLQNENLPFSRRVQAFLARSRFATFSVLLHVVIVVMAGSVVLFRHYSEPPDFTADGGEGLVSTDTQAQPPPPTEQPQETFTPVAPTVSAPQLSAITANTASATAFQMPTAVPQVKAPAMAAMSNDLSKMLANAGNKGTGTVPSAMAGRMGGTARGAAMMKVGGKEASERAVMAGLNWLKSHQNEDGSWSEEFKPGMSGLALLCFLGHGETQTSADFGPTVKKAVDWLIARGNEFDSHMSLTKDGWGGNDGVYQHAICTYAMGEYYSMTQDDRIKDVLTKAVKYIVDGQNENGGWKYRYEKGGDSDTSVTGWQVQALKAAHLTGLQIPGVDEALDKCMLYLKEAQTPNGGFGYHGKNEERYGLGGVGTLCTYFWKQDKDKLVHEGIKYIIDETKKDHPVEYKAKNADLYAWYYNTQACLMFGGNAWTQWNRWFQDEIVNAQNKGDGSWPPMVAPGVGALQTKADGAGPFYRTTLSILMLEVFYRYMPINK